MKLQGTSAAFLRISSQEVPEKLSTHAGFRDLGGMGFRVQGFRI